MNISILDIFSISIGPSSSHTAGPMRAAQKFVVCLEMAGKLQLVDHVLLELYGSLALTGKGHKTDQAIILGISGALPETLDVTSVATKMQNVLEEKSVYLNGKQRIQFDAVQHIVWHYSEILPQHTNGMRFSAYAANGDVLSSQIYYSIGGGFVITDDDSNEESAASVAVPFPFRTATELFQISAEQHQSVRDIILANEAVRRSPAEVRSALLHIAEIMEASINAGCAATGTLHGVLKLKRRAPGLYTKLLQQEDAGAAELQMHWVNTYALAVAEENADGGRIVTAPTNGAAGIVPAVLQYYKKFCNPNFSAEDVLTFLATAGAIAILYKSNASISGAEVGCQGEVGVACSMAAGALAAVLGGTNQQIEKAAEIAMEHNLGLTCDPIAGLVQIPCIERNAIAAVKAINAAKLALFEDTPNRVSLDQVIATMLQTGKDMRSKYKETSLGGLAANVAVC